MKTNSILIFIAGLLLLSFTACKKEINNQQDLKLRYNSEKSNSHSRSCVNTNFQNGLDAWGIADVLNCRNQNGYFTNSRYIDCNTSLETIEFSGEFSTDPNDQNGPLFAAPNQHIYSYIDYIKVMQRLWQKVRAHCGTNSVVITNAEFNVGFFTPTGNYSYYLDATVTVCCSPNLTPYNPGPKVPRKVSVM